MKYLLVLLLTAPTVNAYADAKSDAKDHVAAATQAFRAEKFDDALKDLTLAYALDPDPQLLYAIGQVHVKLGDCTQAATFFNRFVATKPDPKQAAVAQKAIATCKDHPRPVPTPVEVAPPVVEPARVPVVVVQPPPPVIVDRRIPWYRDVLGDVLVIGGVVVGGISGLQLSHAHSERDDADHATTYEAYKTLLDDAHRDQTYAIVGASVGAALIVSGVIRYLTRDDVARDTNLAVTSRGAALMVRF